MVLLLSRCLSSRLMGFSGFQLRGIGATKFDHHRLSVIIVHHFWLHDNPVTSCLYTYCHSYWRDITLMSHTGILCCTNKTLYSNSHALNYQSCSAQFWDREGTVVVWVRLLGFIVQKESFSFDWKKSEHFWYHRSLTVEQESFAFFVFFFVRLIVCTLAARNAKIRFRKIISQRLCSQRYSTLQF